MAIMVEGKWDEAFGPTLGEWKTNMSPGKQQRIQFIQSELGLTGDLPSELRYQLLHRATSAVLEAKRFNAKSAVMLVHSFSPENRWFDDYLNFVRLFQKQTVMNELISLGSVHGIALYAAWVKGVMPSASSADSST